MIARDFILAIGWTGAAGVLIYGAVALAERPYHAIRYRIDKRRGGDVQAVLAAARQPVPPATPETLITHPCGCTHGFVRVWVLRCPADQARHDRRVTAAMERQMGGGQ